MSTRSNTKRRDQVEIEEDMKRKARLRIGNATTEVGQEGGVNEMERGRNEKTRLRKQEKKGNKGEKAKNTNELKGAQEKEEVNRSITRGHCVLKKKRSVEGMNLMEEMDNVGERSTDKRNAEQAGPKADVRKPFGQGDDLKAEEVEELRAAFKELGRDGQLETRKLGAALRALGFMPSEMHLLELTQHVSLNLGGRVTCDDFIDILIPKVLAETRGCFGPRELHLAFNQLDTNGDGLVSLPELRQALRSLLDEPLPAADVEEVLRDGDLNGDGRLDFTEFAKMMSR